jgi:hypothetical protein
MPVTARAARRWAITALIAGLAACNEAPVTEPVPDPDAELPPPAGPLVATVAAIGLTRATGEIVVSNAERCGETFTQSCVVCPAVEMSAIVSGPAGTTVVLDSAQYTYVYLGGALGGRISLPRSEMVKLWGTGVFETGGVYSTNPQNLRADQPFTVTRTFFFRSGALATRGTFSLAFNCG